MRRLFWRFLSFVGWTKGPELIQPTPSPIPNITVDELRAHLKDTEQRVTAAEFLMENPVHRRAAGMSDEELTHSIIALSREIRGLVESLEPPANGGRS